MDSINKISTNNKFKGNPRVITEKQFDYLKEHLSDLGDLAGVVYCHNNKCFVGGNQRSEVFDGSDIEIVELFNKPTKCGTVAHGFIQYNGEKYSYREVMFSENDFNKACIVANNDGGSFDWDILANDWNSTDLEDWGLDTPDDWGEDPKAEEDDYEIPDEIETNIVIGDLIEIGGHRLLCGDSTSVDQVERLMDGDKADMVFTDPPYNINYGNIKHPKFKQREIENDDMSAGDFADFCSAFTSNIRIFTKGCVYVCGPPGSDGRIMFVELDKALHCSTVIIWNKDRFTLGRGKYQNKYEPVWFGWIDSGVGFYGDRKQSNVWDIQRPTSSKEHPTMKPIAIMEKAITHASRNDDIVLDLFLGSGSTMVAAHQLNRKCYGMEIDTRYTEVVVQRMLKLDNTLKIKVNGKDETKKFLKKIT